MKQGIKNIIRNIVPPCLLSLGMSITRKNKFTGSFSTWEEAQRAATGYDSDIILNKVRDSMLKVKNGDAACERDSVLFDKVEYSWPVLAGLLWIASRNKNKLNLVDFGGSLGSSYYIYKKFLDHLYLLKWNIVEQRNFVQCGQQLFEDEILKFYYNLNECTMELNPDTILLSSSIQYLESPYDLLAQIKDRFRYIIVDKTPFIEKDEDAIMIYQVSPEIYNARIPTWLFSLRKFANYITSKFDLIVDYENFSQTVNSNTNVKWKGFIFAKKE